MTSGPKAETGDAGEAALTIRVLGGFAVRLRGQRLTVEARKNRGLLAVLALSPGLSATRDRLIGLLWSDRNEDQARASLRQSLALLRKDLENDVSRVLVIREDEVRLDQALAWSDAAAFRTLARSAKRDDLRKAAELVGGELLAGLDIRDPAFEEWLLSERQAHLREFSLVLERLIPLEEGDLAVAAAQRLVDLDPLRERAQRMLITALANSGETSLALKQLESCRQLLRDELGVEAAAETLALKDLITAGKAAPQLPQAAAPATGRPAAERPVIAVLPLVNLAADPSQTYFSDGITEDLITELSRFRNMGVIARNSSFAFRGRDLGIAAIGRELNASYVLDGSIRREGARVRLTLRLSQVATGEQVWSERYDREVNDIFSLQEDLAQHIAGTLAVEMDDLALERAPGGKLDDERAYDLFLRGKRQMWVEGDSTLQSRRLFEAAVRIDPTLARAHAALAMTYVHEALQFPPAGRFSAALSAAEDGAQAALSLDPAESFGHMALAWVHLYRRDHDRMRRHADLAIRLNPNDADTLANCNYLLHMDGDCERAIELGLFAVTLNPRYPEWYASLLSSSLFSARRYEEAMLWRVRAPATFYDSVFGGAATLARLGRIAEAREWAARACRRLEARLGEDVVRQKGAIQLMLDNNPFRVPEQAEHFAGALRLAGLEK